MEVAGRIVGDLETIIVWVLLTFNFIPQKVTLLTKLADVTVQGVGNPNGWGTECGFRILQYGVC